MLGLAGQSDATAKAHRIMALETAIAERHWPIADRRDRTRTYNLKTRAEVKTSAPNLPMGCCIRRLRTGREASRRQPN